MPGLHEIDDASLLQQAQKGEVEAFGLLYERYASSVFRFLAAHLDSTQDAEDLTADVFLQTWRSLPRYQQRGLPFQAYLMRVARNRLIDHYRRHSGQKTPHSLDQEPQVAPAEDNPGEQALARMEIQELHLVLGRLREEYRTVLLLRFVENFTPQETAKAMQRTVVAIRVLQHRALKALRASLMQREIEDSERELVVKHDETRRT